MESSYSEIVNLFIERYTPEVVGGLIVAILLLVTSYIYGFLKNWRITKKYSGYIGNYYLYSYSSTGKKIIVMSRLAIKARFGKLIVYVDDDTYEYKGAMHISERNLYLNYEGIKHTEQIHLVFHSPLLRSIKKLMGTNVSISPIDEPIAKYSLLSDTEIPNSALTEVFENFILKKNGTILKVPKDISLFFDNIEDNQINKYNVTNIKKTSNNKKA